MRISMRSDHVIFGHLQHVPGKKLIGWCLIRFTYVYSVRLGQQHSLTCRLHNVLTQSYCQRRLSILIT